MALTYWNKKNKQIEQENKQIEQENKQLEQENKFIKKELNAFLNWSALYPWTSIESHKKQWDLMYNIATKDRRKIEKIVNILRKWNLLDIETDNLQKASIITLDKLKLNSPQDVREYSQKIKKVCEIF
ncbi:hypothetical protein [Persephonella sp.]